MFRMNFLDNSTRALFISFALYSPSYDIFVSSEILIEFSVTGAVNPSHVIVDTFYPNSIETNSQKVLFILDIIRLLMNFYLAYLFVLSIVNFNFRKIKNKFQLIYFLIWILKKNSLFDFCYYSLNSSLLLQIIA